MFFRQGDEFQPDSASVHRGGHTFRGFLPVTIVVIALSLCPACSSLSGSSPNTWTGTYFQNPDRVWAAIIETLIDLDYRVAESSRYDGKILTEPREGENLAGVVLSINQIMRTSDQVKVYVSPSAGEAWDGVDPVALKAAADQFMAALNKKLHG